MRFALAIGPIIALAAATTVAATMSGCGSSDVSRAVGARCDDNTECAERCQSGDDYPGGFCTLSCDSDDDCPASAKCVARDSGICMLGCRIEDETGCDFMGVGWSCETLDALTDGEVTVCVGDL